MDAQLRREAEDLFEQLGITISAAVNIFVRQAVRDQAIPFLIHIDYENQDYFGNRLNDRFSNNSREPNFNDRNRLSPIESLFY